MGVRRLFDRLDQSYLNGLVVKAKQGNSNAFAELFASVAGRQLYYLTRLSGSRDEAIRMLPDVFSAVYSRLPSLAKTDLFMPWICRIAAQEYMVRSGHRAADDAGFDLSRLLNLPIAESQILLMSLVQGLSDDEIADLLNVGRRTVRRFTKMGRRHLTRNGPAGERELQRAKAAGGRSGASRARNVSELTTLETSEILDAVFSACGEEGNTVPMETISSYAVYRKERFTLQRVIVAMALLVFMMLPLLFVLPSYTVSIEDNGSRGLPVYTVRVNSFLPVGRVLASIKDHALPVYEAGAREFTVEPTRNGSLDISVELINNQSVSTEHDVTSVDAEGPALVDSKTYSDGFMLKVSDAGIGVDYRDVYAVSESGEVHYPVTANEEEGIVFTYPDETWDIYIPDHIGNTLHLSVKLH